MSGGAQRSRAKWDSLVRVICNWLQLGGGRYKTAWLLHLAKRTAWDSVDSPILLAARSDGGAGKRTDINLLHRSSASRVSVSLHGAGVSRRSAATASAMGLAIAPRPVTLCDGSPARVRVKE